MQTLLIQYCETCFHSFTSNLLTVSDEYSIEAVHNLRLSVKRIRALLKLLDQESYLIDSKLIKQIDTLYLYSGQLLDIHIQILLLELYRDKVGNEVEIVANSIGKGKKSIFKRLDKSVQVVDLFDIVLLNHRLDCYVESIDSLAHETICRQRIDMLHEQIVQQIAENPSEKTLHRIRIMLKELIYTLSIFKKGKLTTNYTAADIKKLNSLQQTLGSWHDSIVLLNKIRSIAEERGTSYQLSELVENDVTEIQKRIIESFIWIVEKVI